MNLVESDATDIREIVTQIHNIEEKTSSNGNEYVLLETAGREQIYVWNESWKEHILENKEFYKINLMRVNFEAVDPPYYCVLRSIFPQDWEENQNLEEYSFEVNDMTEDDDKLKMSDVSREERIVNQSSIKFGAEMAKLKEDWFGTGSEEEFDEEVEKEINSWARKFKRAVVTGEL